MKRENFVLRTDDFIAQWRAVQAGLGVGFCASYMADNEPDVMQVLAGALKI